MTKQEYHKLKRHLKTLSRPQIEKLYDELKLNVYEIHLLSSWYDGDSVVKIAMNNYISERCYTKHIKKVFLKIYNYYVYKDIPF